MSKNHIDYTDQRVTPATPFVYRRPRCAVRHLLRQLTAGGVARIGVQVLLSASLIAGGIIVTGPIGAALAFTGFCFAFATEDDQTPEEYRQAVIAHFEGRGQTPPRWTRQGGAR